MVHFPITPIGAGEALTVRVRIPLTCVQHASSTIISHDQHTLTTATASILLHHVLQLFNNYSLNFV